MMRIAHLSDIHLDNDRAYEADTFILKALFEDLKEFHNKAPIDIVIISGDLVDKGGASFENSLEVALLTFEEKVLEPIRKNLNISKDRIFICPGNHDIDRDADEFYTERGLCQTLVCTDDVNTFCCSNKTNGIKRILKYKEFEQTYHKNFANNHEITNFHSAFRLSLDFKDIGIACLNTCWRCYDSNTDKGKILLGERQLMESKRIIENCTIKIAVLHHPIDWLAEFDRKAVRNIIQRDFNLLFCGHTHDSESWTNTSFYGGLFACIAPSNWAYNIRSNDSNLYCGYSIVDYDLKLNKITVHNRKYYHTKQKFDPNIENANNKGIVELNIPSSNQLSTIHEEIKVVGNLENIYIDTINDHLITYNTNTKAPKAIDDLFVHPNIVQTVTDHEDNNPTKKEISIDEILLSDANQLVFGIKESGKTILLDKLSIELIKKNTKYKKVPVYIDYPTVRNQRFETIFSRFLNIKIHSVDEFLNNHRVVLLIDNINFNNTDISNLDRLSKFVSNYPSIQIIATVLQYIEGQIPIRHLSFDFYKTFETHHILGFKTKQIKELIVLWFSNSEHSVSQKYFSGIIDFFVSLNLPRTPLAISMYLWIIEHQENYRPINHAVMLENFIERILEKLSKKEVFTDEFGYTNKLHLLAEIAHKMLNLNNANYRIESHDLFNFIHEQIKSRRFDYLAENVLNHFLNVGILVKEIEDSVTYIRFRFSCFFQFFLMKFMEYDEDFHNHVLDEENFLDFIDEIDYFTGLKRDCSDVLSRLVNRMMLEFKDIVEEIEKLPMEYDEFFREDEPIITHIPEKN